MWKHRSIPRPMGTRVAAPELSPGGPAAAVSRNLEGMRMGDGQPVDREFERLRIAGKQDRLARLREVAKRWLEIISSLVAIFGIVAIVGFPNKIENLSDKTQTDVGWLILIAIICSFLSILLSGLSSIGLPKKSPSTRQYDLYANHLDSEINWSVFSFYAALGFGVVVFLSITAAIIVTWQSDPVEASWLLNESKGTPGAAVVRCGNLQMDAQTGAIYFVPPTPGAFPTVPVIDTSTLVERSSCPSVGP